MTLPSKKESILNTATSLFAEYGYHAVGIDRIIAESSTAKMTLYKYFPSKEILIESVLFRRDQQLRDSIMQALAKKKNGISKLKGIFDWYEAWIKSSDFHGCMFIKASEEYSDIEKTIRTISRDHKQWLRGLLESILENMEIRSAKELATHIMTTLDGATVTANIFKDANENPIKTAWHYTKYLVKQSS